MTRSRILTRVLAATFAAAVLSSCSTHPGSAAVVGDETISDARLDDVASALCIAQSGAGAASGQAKELSSRSARQIALSVLLESSLSLQYGASQGVQADPGKVASAVSSREQVIGSLPEEHRDGFRQALSDFAEGQLTLVEIGTNALASQGTANPTQEQAVSQGTKMRNAWADKNLDVEVDPRFGTYSQGNLLTKSGSLSVAESKRAVDGDSADPSPGWVAQLPASQKCG